MTDWWASWPARFVVRLMSARQPQPGTVLPLDYVLANWRPGSYDHDWDTEFRRLGSPDAVGGFQVRTWDEHGKPRDELLLQMLRGVPVPPVTLGWDGGEWQGREWNGRVWAGHHRLWVYQHLGLTDIPVDVVPAGERRSTVKQGSVAPGRCAPDEGRD